jgi:pyrroline-5-carboxylate reductase
MAEALISQLKSPPKIIASDINKKRLNYLKKKYRIKVVKNNLEVFDSGDIVILAVKPQNMANVLGKGLGAKDWGRGKLIISIAAGIPLSYLQKKLPGLPIVRAMPNNPCLVGMGMTALAGGKKVSRAQFNKAAAIFKAVGEVVEVKEKVMDAVTGLSGSGPAYVYQSIEALAYGGVAAGLPQSTAAQLALMTVLGAAGAVLKSGKAPSDLREMVTSPGGTTLEGLKVLKRRKFSRALVEAVVAAARKSKKLSQKWTS